MKDIITYKGLRYEYEQLQKELSACQTQHLSILVDGIYYTPKTVKGLIEGIAALKEKAQVMQDARDLYFKETQVMCGALQKIINGTKHAESNDWLCLDDVAAIAEKALEVMK